MPFDGSGNFNRTFPPGGWQGDAAGAIKIRADRHDQHDSDLAQGLSNVICRDGQSQITANIPFNAKKIINLGTPTAPTDAATKAYVDNLAATSSYVPPIGGGMEFWGSTPPPKWLLAHGQALSRITYAQLFAVMGTNFGAGDGSTTFNVPDVRGRTIVGKDNMGGTSADRLTALSGGVNGDVLGAVGGAQSHALTEAELAAHTHPVTGTGSGTAASSGSAHTHNVPIQIHIDGFTSGPQDIGMITGGATATETDGAHTHTVSVTSLSATATSTGSGAAHNNVQPTIVANYIIYAGV